MRAEKSISPRTISRALSLRPAAVVPAKPEYGAVVERQIEQGRVGGDSGGYVTHHWTAAPLTVKGKKVRLKGSTCMASPSNYRVRTDIAEGDPFVSMGAVWMQRARIACREARKAAQ
jgi:hypothetical protein